VFNKTKVLFVLSAAAKLSANLSFRPVRSALLFPAFPFALSAAPRFPGFSFRLIRTAPFSRLFLPPDPHRPVFPAFPSALSAPPRFPAFRPLPGRTCRNILNFCLENLQCLII